MLNEFIDYTLEPSVAWAKSYIETTDQGELRIDYGINLWGRDLDGHYEITYWARATLKPHDRYFPIFVQQRYHQNPKILLRGIYSDLRVAIQS